MNAIRPRGRIMLMQQMLESGATPNAETVLHLDRCLSCLGCRSACPSGVDYAALIDQSRVHIEQTYRRPPRERIFRNFILFVLTRPALFGFMSSAARLFSPIASRLPGHLGAMSRKAMRTKHRVSFPAEPQSGKGKGSHQPRVGVAKDALRAADAARMGPLPSPRSARLAGDDTQGMLQRGHRILLLPGCVQRALAPEIDAAAGARADASGR